MTDKKGEPLLSDKIRAEKAHQRACEMHGDPMGSGSDWIKYYKAHTGGTFDARTFYEAARAKDAELIQRLVDAIAYSRKHGPPVSLSDSHWDISLHNALSYAAAAGFKPSEQ